MSYYNDIEDLYLALVCWSYIDFVLGRGMFPSASWKLPTHRAVHISLYIIVHYSDNK